MFLAQLPPPGPHDLLSILLGAAAVLLVAGWTFTRWQRDRLRFDLMRSALEKGVTRFPGTPPYWLVSLRQGVTLVAVGVGLGLAGGTAWWVVRDTPLPKGLAVSTTQPARVEREQEPEDRPPRRLAGRPGEDRPGEDRPGEDRPGEDREGRPPFDAPPPREEREGPGGRGGDVPPAQSARWDFTRRRDRRVAETRKWKTGIASSPNKPSAKCRQPSDSSCCSSASCELGSQKSNNAM